MDIATYACSDSVDYVSATALNTLASVCYCNGHLGVLVEDLLNAAGVAARFLHRLGLTCFLRLFMFIDSAGIQAVPESWLFIVAAGSRSVRRLKASVCNGISLPWRD